jgi:hypothetical protein
MNGASLQPIDLGPQGGDFAALAGKIKSPSGTIPISSLFKAEIGFNAPGFVLLCLGFVCLCYKNGPSVSSGQVETRGWPTLASYSCRLMARHCALPRACVSRASATKLSPHAEIVSSREREMGASLDMRLLGMGDELRRASCRVAQTHSGQSVGARRHRHGLLGQRQFGWLPCFSAFPQRGRRPSYTPLLVRLRVQSTEQECSEGRAPTLISMTRLL